MRRMFKSLPIQKIACSLLVGLAVSASVFALLAWLPDSVFQGILEGFLPAARGEYYKIRLVEFSHERTPGLFTLHVRISNISNAPLDKVQAVVTLNDSENSRAEALVYPVEPARILPAQEVAFNISFPETIPIQRYAVFFKDGQGETLPHRK